jgi:hypothetical protein
VSSEQRISGSQALRRLVVRPISCFTFEGERRVLREPEGTATHRQLVRLSALGLLALVEPGQVDPVTKGEAAAALDVLLREQDEAHEARS